MQILFNVMEQGLIFGIVAVGVYITYRILDFPDLSVDGSFPLGAAITAAWVVKGGDPYVACLLAIIGGCLAGFLTGFLHVVLKISNLLSGILVMMALYSINLRVMKKPNESLLMADKLILPGSSEPIVRILIVLAFAMAVKLLIDLFLKTKLGFVLKAVGDNEQLVTSLAINKSKIKVIGLVIANGLVALAGSILAQSQSYSDVNMGTGVVVMGLAAVIVGEALIGYIKKLSPLFNFIKATSAVIVGAIVYQAALALAMRLGLPSSDLKLITATIVVLALSLNGDLFKKFKFTRKSSVGGDGIAPNTKSA
ncbi:ABC transporter permease [Clostridium thermarum]|uniref:ABC transporter permease n=1 Tax=Clostridium thermarum TaxID=1716543 RepID=UPI0013D17015|nr:ABC transporter permease [Clostridium thermarum]